MWEAAGIKVNIRDYSLQPMLGITFSGSWQAIDENWGPSVDPTINDEQFFKERRHVLRRERCQPERSVESSPLDSTTRLH